MKPQLLVAITVENESVQEMLNQGLQELRMALQKKALRFQPLHPCGGGAGNPKAC